MAKDIVINRKTAKLTILHLIVQFLEQTNAFSQIEEAQEMNEAEKQILRQARDEQIESMQSNIVFYSKN